MKDYRIICDLGEGGFGTIQLAEREGSGSLCGVKKLKGEGAAEASATGAFMREAQVGALLDHKNIARLIDARFEDGELLVCTEFVAGQDLDAIALRLQRDAKLVPPELSVTAMLS